MRTELGKIQKAEFGFGGYQEVMIGISFTLGGNAWGVGDFWGAWGIERSDNAKWTEDDRLKQLGEVSLRIKNILEGAQVQTISELAGTPIECTFDGMVLKSWRVLTEVI